jgi:thioredoxin-like negative regulator of GroEL
VHRQVRGLGDIAAKFGVSAAPALLVACNGDPETAERFSGEFKSEPIRNFLAKFAGGRKCASAIKVRATLHCCDCLFWPPQVSH